MFKLEKGPRQAEHNVVRVERKCRKQVKVEGASGENDRHVIKKESKRQIRGTRKSDGVELATYLHH